MHKINKTTLASLMAVLAAWTCSAQPGLIGSTVDLSLNFPTSTTVDTDYGAATVTGGVEYPNVDYGIFQLQITANQLILTDIGGFSGGFVDFPFNGFDLTVVSGPGIQSAVADASSQFDPVGISIVGGDQLFLNYEGDSINPGWSSVIDYSTASVPDGGVTGLLLGGALFGLGLLRRKLA
jgi:hypothetical protein